MKKIALLLAACAAGLGEWAQFRRRRWSRSAEAQTSSRQSQPGGDGVTSTPASEQSGAATR